MGDITKDFSMYEMTRSSTAKKHGINNKPNLDQFKRLCQSAVGMQMVRDLLDRSISPSSWLRVDELNKAIGSKGKEHPRGTAIDFGADWSHEYLREAYNKIISSEIPYTKIIFEDHLNSGTKWIHIEFSFDKAEKHINLISYRNEHGKVKYETTGSL